MKISTNIEINVQVFKTKLDVNKSSKVNKYN